MKGGEMAKIERKVIAKKTTKSCEV